MTTERILMKDFIQPATLEDIPEQERSPIRTFAEHELPRAEKIRDVRADKEDATQTVFQTPGTTYTQLALF